MEIFLFLSNYSDPCSPSMVYIHIRVIVHDSDNHTHRKQNRKQNRGKHMTAIQ
jgi:hypothetical protein